MNRYFIITIFVLLTSCKKQESGIRIGFSYPYKDAGWGEMMYREVVNELNIYRTDNVSLITRDAGNDIEKQNSDIIDLYFTEKVDVLIVFPRHGKLHVPAIEQVYDKGLPVIILDRKVETDKFTSFIGHLNNDFGIEAGKYAVNQLEAGTILEIKGAKGTSTTNGREEGFHSIINKHPQLNIEISFYSEWLDSIVEHKTDSLFREGFRPDLIYAHNDNMAKKAKEIALKHNFSPFTIGIDGLLNEGGGIDMVLNNEIDVTFFNRPGGDIAVKTAVALAKGEKVDKYNHLNTFPIDKTNVQGIRHGFDMVSDQQEKFNKLHKYIGIMAEKIRYQQVIIYLTIILIFFTIVIIITILYFFKQKQRYIQVIAAQKQDIENKIEEEKALTDKLSNANSILEEHKKEIQLQNDTLERYRFNLESIVEERTRELTTALNKAEESDKLKASFISNLSHELRTPVNAILGFSELLFEDSYSEKDRKRFHDLVVHNSYQLIRLMEDILEISLISANQIDFNYSSAFLPDIMNDTYEKIQGNIEKGIYNESKSIQLHLESVPKISLETDIVRVQQILEYLIDNAMKFTKEGEVRFGVQVVGDFNELKFYVKDTGIGINSKYHDVIFDRFRKIEENQHVLYRGNGLGLTIAKFLTERFGGKIWVESEIDKGSAFYFTLSSDIDAQREAAKSKKNPNTIEIINDKNVLVTEDEKSNYLFIEAILKKNKVNVMWAQNGLEAIKTCQTNKKIDLVLMDIKMPKLNGVEAMKEIKMINPDIPIIAITAYAQIDDRGRFLKEGFDDYLSKPIKSSLLFETMAKLLE
ncbi:MAG: substrate-binding domain-containing protein [Bacteroidales bacterium]|nr:substrate-binding domain-containing protein [Bacteroidales bacterium]